MSAIPWPFKGRRGKNHVTITNSQSETEIFPAYIGVYNDIYGLIITNTSASACTITIKDGTGGTTEMVFSVPAGDTRGLMLPKEAAIQAAAAGTNWTATCSGSVSSIEISTYVHGNS